MVQVAQEARVAQEYLLQRNLQGSSRDIQGRCLLRWWAKFRAHTSWCCAVACTVADDDVGVALGQKRECMHVLGEWSARLAGVA